MHAAGKESSNALGLAGWIGWASGALGWPGYRITNSIAGYRIASPYYPVAGCRITYSLATLSYDNYYVNLRYYSNSILSGLL